MTYTWDDLDLEFHVISTRKSERRRSRLEQELSERRIRHRFIDAIDGDDVAAVRAAFVCDLGFVPKIDAPRTRPLSSRELACTLSHMLAIRRAHDMGLRQVVVRDWQSIISKLGNYLQRKRTMIRLSSRINSLPI